MKRAADELQDPTLPTNKRVKIDGSWQEWEHVSLNNVVTAIVEDKCVDYQVLTKHCLGCKMWGAKKNQPGRDLWKTNHICNINHTKLFGTMEAAGAIDIFNRSIDLNNSIYHEYLEHGDTTLFKEVLDVICVANMLLFQVRLNA